MFFFLPRDFLSVLSHLVDRRCNCIPRKLSRIINTVQNCTVVLEYLQTQNTLTLMSVNTLFPQINLLNVNNFFLQKRHNLKTTFFFITVFKMFSKDDFLKYFIFKKIFSFFCQDTYEKHIFFPNIKYRTFSTNCFFKNQFLENIKLKSVTHIYDLVLIFVSKKATSFRKQDFFCNFSQLKNRQMFFPKIFNVFLNTV